MYPRWKHRGASAEELGKDPTLHRSKLVNTLEEERQLGPGWHDHLHEVPEVRAVHHPEPEKKAIQQAAAEEMPIVEQPEVIEPPDVMADDEKSIVDMSEEELRNLLCEKHGWPKKKLAKKNKEQLLAIFSS